jgi:RNA polymerase sigma-70 factor (ECF subfamily)
VNLPSALPSTACPARAGHEARDAELAACLHEVAAGSGAAFERFYDKTVAYAQALARRLLSGTEVDDVLSEAYLQVWRDAARFDAARGSAVTWLLTIVRSRALDALRRHRAAPDHEPLAPDAEIAHEAPGPEALLQSVESASSVHAALARLSEQERWLLGLAYFRDLSHGQISAATGLPLGTVKSSINRAQAKLREWMGTTGRDALLP